MKRYKSIFIEAKKKYKVMKDVSAKQVNKLDNSDGFNLISKSMIKEPDVSKQLNGKDVYWCIDDDGKLSGYLSDEKYFIKPNLKSTFTGIAILYK
jgi:hypothetical protein